MTFEDKHRSISMICPTCACSDFQYVEDDEVGPVVCAACKRSFTRNELIAENGEIIEANMTEMKNDAIGEIHQQFEAMFHKAFGNNPNFKLIKK